MRNEADAVEASRPPVPSTLPAGADEVAQALLAHPELRSLAPLDLARALGASVADARLGIASVVGLAHDRRRGASLTSHPAIARAVAFQSLDAALERYASDVGPIERSPSVVPMNYGRYRHGEAGALDDSGGATDGGGTVYVDHGGGTPGPGFGPPTPPTPVPAPAPSGGGGLAATVMASPLLIAAGVGGALYFLTRKKRGRR